MSDVSWSCKAQTCHDTSTLTKPTFLTNIIDTLTFGIYTNVLLRDEYCKQNDETVKRNDDLNASTQFKFSSPKRSP